MESQNKDLRFYLAAERTFLAWIRTGLALMGLGFVLARFIFPTEFQPSRITSASPPAFSVWVGTAVILVGVVVNVVSTAHHIHLVRRLNRGEEIAGRPSATAISTALLLAAVGLAMVIYLLVFR